MKWSISGLEIWSRWNSGTIFGSMRALRLFTSIKPLKSLFPKVICSARKTVLKLCKIDDWDTENQQIYSDIIYSLNRDVTPSSRPIIADVRNPDEITAAFDWVIYQKGSSVIYMIKEALGIKSYHQAILVRSYVSFIFLFLFQNYLEEFQYSDATELDLLKHVQAEIDKENIKIDGKPLDAIELWMPFLRQR